MTQVPDRPAEGDLPLRAAAAGLAAADDWRALFARYSDIVLVANSTASDVAALRAQYPRDALFVFFNSFALNMWLQYRQKGPWRDYLFGERAYMVLSLTAKSALAWQVFASTLVG